MEDAMLKFSLPENILQPLFSVSNSSTLDETLELLIEASKTPGGRLDLGSKNILPVVLQLSQSLSYPSGHDILLLSLKLLRNLCAGEMTNQNLFIEQNGVKAVSTILLSFVGLDSDSDYGIIRMGLQLLGNVSLAGERHQRAVWHHFFPAGFLEIARVRTLETSDPLCMVIYTCFDQSHEFITEICGDQGLPILAEIVRTASTGKPGFVFCLSLFLANFNYILVLRLNNRTNTKCFNPTFECCQLVLKKIG